jgi:putative transcriptional regulator
MALPQFRPATPGLAPDMRMAFTSELGEIICARLAGGETVTRVCAAPDMPCRWTVYHWRDAYRGFGQSMVAAQQAGARIRATLRMEAKAAKARPKSPHKWAHTGSRAHQARRRAAVLEVARRLANRETLRQICADPEMPGLSSLHGWLHEDPDLALIYGEARAAQRASYDAEIHDIFANLTQRNRRESRRRFRRLHAEMSRRAAKGWGLEQRPPPMPKTWDAALAAWERAGPAQPVDSPSAIQQARKRLGLSQAQFAARFGLSAETLRNYEQGHRRPTGPTRVLLAVIAAEPAAVMRVVGR